MAVTEADPPAIVAKEADRVADAPEVGAVNITTPPLIGSAELLAVTVTAKGFAKAVPPDAVCPVPPATRLSVNPWLWKAPISGLGASSGSPRWSVVTPVTATPAPMAGLPGSRAKVSVVPP